MLLAAERLLATALWTRGVFANASAYYAISSCTTMSVPMVIVPVPAMTTPALTIATPALHGTFIAVLPLTRIIRVTPSICTNSAADIMFHWRRTVGWGDHCRLVGTV